MKFYVLTILAERLALKCMNPCTHGTYVFPSFIWSGIWYPFMVISVHSFDCQTLWLMTLLCITVCNVLFYFIFRLGRKDTRPYQPYCEQQPGLSPWHPVRCVVHCLTETHPPQHRLTALISLGTVQNQVQRALLSHRGLGTALWTMCNSAFIISLSDLAKEVFTAVCTWCRCCPHDVHAKWSEHVKLGQS